MNFKIKALVCASVMFSLGGCGASSLDNQIDETAQNPNSNTQSSPRPASQVATARLNREQEPRGEVESTSMEQATPENNDAADQADLAAKSNSTNTNYLTSGSQSLPEATPTSVADSGNCMDQLDQDMLAAVNTARSTARSCGGQQMPAVVPVKFQCQLKDAAQDHTEDMATNGVLSHTGSDGTNLSTRVNETGYSWASVSENIAYGQASVDEVMTGWLASAGHCRNIMNADSTQMGAGFAISPGSNNNGVNYWTQVFARQTE